MKTESFCRKVQLPATAEEAFAWHARPGAFERLIPPWENVEVVNRSGGIDEGARVELLTKVGPFQLRWNCEHRHCEPGREFNDVQLKGPFALWKHRHGFEPVDEASSNLDDEIQYALPGGVVGRLFGGGMVRNKLDRMFAYRHATTVADLALHSTSKGARPMKIAVTGASGMVGSAFAALASTGGHEVLHMVRREANSADEIAWDPANGTIDADRLADVDAVVHLAGDNISEGRWTEAKKAMIRSSRVDGTRLISETLAKLDPKPRVLVAASAIGFYGNRGDEALDETAAAGEGFLADVCREWEEATQAAADAGIRVVNLRIGVVLSPRGGAIKKMLTPFKLGLGGKVGNGRQYMSWISIDDVIGTIHHAMMNEELSGPVNAVAPGAVSNYDFTKTLGKVLKRPTIFPMPAFAAKMAFGQMADDLLLSSTRVVPAKLVESGYEFRHPQLEGALRHVLGR
ncbi:MAG: TIGR01777 family oxidoreductase [Pirellulales bacterium]|nr:TIGR01777 family oxidoreductase [Pirellulales bacterium]